MKNQKITFDGTVKFPEPKQIDWRKYIQPMKQDFITTKSGAKISNMIPSN